MKKVIDIVEDNDDDKGFSFSVGDLVESKDEDSTILAETAPVPVKKRGPGRPSKNGSNTYTDIVVADKKKEKSLDKQFEKGYYDNAKMLYGAIAQTDQVYSNIEEELSKFRNNRSYGGRSRSVTMSNFLTSQVGLINTKIAAVRELNSIRSKINDLVLKKEQMLKDTGDDNSDKAIMDAYYALVNAPNYGLPSYKQQLASSTINTGINASGNILASTGIVTAGTANSDKQSFNDYKQNLSPIQKRMISSKDPNIKTVVVYNQSTGDKYFDVINVSTGMSVPDVQRPAEFLLNDVRVDIRNGIAINSNTNMSYPLVIIGTRAADEL